MCDPLDDLIARLFTRRAQFSILREAVPFTAAATPHSAPSTIRASGEASGRGRDPESRQELMIAAIGLTVSIGYLGWRFHVVRARQREHGNVAYQVKASSL
jgi:hypothetical protein